MTDADKCGPPWIVFFDRGKSVAILPAGRPGEVADVSALPDELVRRIVECANARERGYYESIHDLTERLESVTKVIDESKTARIAELEAALRPFAEMADFERNSDEARVWGTNLTAGDMRRARAALEKKP